MESDDLRNLWAEYEAYRQQRDRAEERRNNMAYILARYLSRQTASGLTLGEIDPNGVTIRLEDFDRAAEQLDDADAVWLASGERYQTAYAIYAAGISGRPQTVPDE